MYNACINIMLTKLCTIFTVPFCIHLHDYTPYYNDLITLPGTFEATFSIGQNIFRCWKKALTSQCRQYVCIYMYLDTSLWFQQSRLSWHNANTKRIYYIAQDVVWIWAINQNDESKICNLMIWIKASSLFLGFVISWNEIRKFNIANITQKVMQWNWYFTCI